MSILIITHSDDNECVARVAAAIARKGGHTIHFDTDRYPTDVRLSAYYGGSGDERLTLTNDEGEFDLREVTAVWHRRLNFGAQLPAGLDKQLRHVSVGEASAAAHGMLASLKAFRMDHLHHIRHAENKQLQLQVARELGLETPRTLTTNDRAAAGAFAKSCEGAIVTKMLSSFAIYEEGKELVVFTNPVKPEDLADLTGLSLCPATFQELLPKSLEIRVTIVGDRVMSASVDSQVSARAAHDWRRDGLRMVHNWEPYQLPLEFEEKILRLMDYFSLNYGAIDVILTPEGKHVFLELNPSGEFFWLERTPGLPVSDAIADLLLGRSSRRQASRRL
ncbi:MAG: MvdD family ATP-grasp ribosomal peptide maturase [Acidobacteria bacterium]|nr:MvdD family ATP-grasp ribosomal peptide maturase [Acidobacteriota bacterium]MCA1627681.1 MvdD family ATP-grasp ribosomal peptide maturase [Acidobacteriota bacterium]